VVFGASGDLAARKLYPAMAALADRGLLTPRFALVGVGRTPLSDEGFQDRVGAATSRAGPTWKEIVDHARYVAGDYDSPELYERIAGVLADIDASLATDGNRVYYLATPSSVFEPVIDALGRQPELRPARGRGFRRLVIEKPFGHDGESARHLDEVAHRGFGEEDIYRIDHYLGKETVQNVLALRFANAVFEPIWNRRYVDNVQITVAESIGVGHRAGFYESAGALRDIVQNHVLQVLALMAMEPPANFDAEGIRDEKIKALRAVPVLTPDEAVGEGVRAQYDAGVVEDEPVPGYREAAGVAPDSRTETFVAMRLHVDNWRWAGVPFFVRTASDSRAGSPKWRWSFTACRTCRLPR
jgi:glucose-6-phosphate 1-dehydrogenase